MNKKVNDPLATQLIDSLLDDENQATDKTLPFNANKNPQQKSPLASSPNENGKLGGNLPPISIEIDIDVPPLKKNDALTQGNSSENKANPDKTFVLGQTSSDTQTSDVKDERRPIVDRKTKTDIRYGLGQLAERRVIQEGSGAVMTSAEASLKQSESLRIAQTRILDLEGELDRIRRENEKLMAAGETIRRRSEEFQAKAESLEMQLRESENTFNEEKKIFKSTMVAKDKELSEMKGKLEELEHRLENNFKKIRVRERELEHRLEIVRIETSTIISTKDQMILKLKREIDRLALEADTSKANGQSLYNKLKDKQETAHRVVRALRIALTILEGEEEQLNPVVKKAE